MTYRTNPILEKLDQAAEMTGFPEFSRQARRHVALPFRIAPLILLVLAVGAMVLQTRVPLTGWIVLCCLWSAAFPLLLAGPMRIPPGGVRDERERALVRSGHFAGLLAVAVLTIGGCFLAGLASAAAMLHWVTVPWTPTGINDWLALGFFLLIVENNVAIAFVSWTMPLRTQMDDEG